MGRQLPGRPFLNKIDIKRFQAKSRFWPPPDASPVTAIEPWGKQFFIYNGLRNIELIGDARAPEWGAVRPQWWLEDIAVSLLKPDEDPNQILTGLSFPEEVLNEPENQTHTHLCVTDFRKRPLMYLSQAELSTIRENLAGIKQELAKFKAQVERSEAKEIDRLNNLLEDDKYRHIRRGRIMNPPSRTGRGVMSSPNRPPRSKPSRS
jgi:hypothetical protein